MNICKVIIVVGGWRPPDVIGLCEVENRKVLEDLLHHTPLSKLPYRIIHYDSPDRRGIDVALLVNENTTRAIQHKCFRINKQGLYTRDILYIKAMLGSDTCHFFVNHWPSRSAGQLETEKDRFAAAMLLKHLTDSLFAVNAKTKILIMGDFNDDPADESMAGKLNARVSHNNILPAGLYNLTIAPSSGPVKGTLKYQGAWNTFDQIIVSGRLLMEQKGLLADSNGTVIMQQNFLLKSDETYNGYKPYRTYNGFIYQGGFSDHLPVYVDLVSR
jgi:endonuclease/exonuclease/phosphatase family metal-dependent hydrolase